MARHPRSAVATKQQSARTLTDKEAALVAALVSSASEGKSLSRTEAGMLAGYGSGETARVSASRALSRPAVRAALVDGLKDAAVVDASAAYAALRHVTDKATSTRDRIAAARTTLEMAGLVGSPAAPIGPPITFTLNFKHSPDAARILSTPPASLEHIDE